VLTWYLEGILNGDPHIKSAVMFGRGRFNAGAIIDPKPEFAFDPEDQEKLAEFRNMIWCVDYLFHTPNQSPRSENVRCLGTFFDREAGLTVVLQAND